MGISQAIKALTLQKSFSFIHRFIQDIFASYHIFKYRYHVPLSLSATKVLRVKLQANHTGTTTTELIRAKNVAQIVKMHLSFQACFIAISLVLTVNGVKSTPSCAKPYDKKMACNLICNFMLDSDANDAMKMLQAKLESLMAMVNKTSTPPPTALPGPPTTTGIHRFYSSLSLFRITGLN